ncbi:MAG: STAS domain-containing protein [Lachnospiraceae bacterium]|nr:STAS domain-containing protein [Lachnospiraceae bacterium]
MNIIKNTEEKVLTIAVEGRLDTVTAPELEEEIKNIPDEVEALVLDFANLEYISSAGLRVLLSAHKNMALRDGMKVRNVNEIVSEVFDVTGFAEILDVE